MASAGAEKTEAGHNRHYRTFTAGADVACGQIVKHGEINGRKTAQNPDIFASVNPGHLRQLRKFGTMHDHMIHIHNKLELMAAAGNPKGIKGPRDLARDDLVQSPPNPLTEGIFRFYGAEMLRDLGLHEKLTGNAMRRS